MQAWPTTLWQAHEVVDTKYLAVNWLAATFRQPSAQFEGSTSQLPEEKAYSKDKFARPITFLQFAVTGHRCFEGSNWSLGCLKLVSRNLAPQ